jgi:hypothetical protein
MAKGTRTNNDLQNTAPNIKDRATRTTLKLGMNSGTPEGLADRAPLVTPIVLPLNSVPICFTTLCNKVSQCLATGWWFSPDPPVSSTNKTDHHDITEILLEVALNTIKQTNKYRFGLQY